MPKPGEPPAPKKPGPPGKKAEPPKVMTTHQKDMLGSGFVDSGAARRRDAMIGGAAPVRITHEELPAATAPVAAPSDLTTRDVWKAIVAPHQSLPGQRTRASYEQVLAQFNVGTNPRYEPDGPEKNRGHIFIWDVTRALGCEIPHFVGAKELTLSQTCDWLRHEGPMRGWRKVSDGELYAGVKLGYPVIAVPREIRLRQMAFIHPQDQSGTRPLCTGAGLQRGAGLQLADVLGVRVVDYFGHE